MNLPPDEELARELWEAYQLSLHGEVVGHMYDEWLDVARRAKELLCVDNRQSE